MTDLEAVYRFHYRHQCHVRPRCGFCNTVIIVTNTHHTSFPLAHTRDTALSKLHHTHAGSAFWFHCRVFCFSLWRPYEQFRAASVRVSSVAAVSELTLLPALNRSFSLSKFCWEQQKNGDVWQMSRWTQPSHAAHSPCVSCAVLVQQCLRCIFSNCFMSDKM